MAFASACGFRFDRQMPSTEPSRSRVKQPLVHAWRPLERSAVKSAVIFGGEMTQRAEALLRAGYRGRKVQAVEVVNSTQRVVQYSALEGHRRCPRDVALSYNTYITYG